MFSFQSGFDELKAIIGPQMIHYIYDVSSSRSRSRVRQNDFLICMIYNVTKAGP